MKRQPVKKDDITKIRELQNEIYGIVKKNNDRKNAERIVMYGTICIDKGENFRVIHEAIVGAETLIVGILIQRAREIMEGHIGVSNDYENKEENGI